MVKNTQHYKDWESIINQVKALQSNVSSEPQVVNDKSLQRPTPFFNTNNPFMTMSDSGMYALSSMPPTTDKAAASKETKIKFVISMKGLDLGVKANHNGDTILIALKSQPMECRGNTFNNLMV